MIAEHNCFPEDWIGKELFISNDHVCSIGGKSSVHKIIVSNYKIISASWIPDGVIRIDLDTNGLKYFYVGFQRYYTAYGDETKPHDINAFNKAVEECKRLRAEEKERKNPRKETKQAESNNIQKSTNLGVGAVIAGAGAIIGSAKKAFKDLQAIDDMSQLEEASNKILDNMQNQWAQYDEEETDPSWFTDNDPWEEQEKKQKTKLANYHKEIIKIIKESQNSTTLYEAMILMVGFESNILKNACAKLAKNPAQTDIEFDLWAQIFLGIQQGQVTSQKDLEDCMKQMTQFVNVDKRKTRKKNTNKDVNYEGSNDKEEAEKQIAESSTKNQRLSKSNESHKKTVNGEKYDDLIMVGFKKDKSDGDYFKPKNMFDFKTRSINKQISSYKSKWNDSMWKIDHELKKKIITQIVHIEEETIKLIACEEKLNKLIQEGKSTGFWGFGGSKEVNRVKDQINRIKDRISEYKDKLNDVVDDLDSCEDRIKECSDNLYELTGLEIYSKYKPLDGNGISVARQLVKCKIDPYLLKDILGL